MLNIQYYENISSDLQSRLKIITRKIVNLLFNLGDVLLNHGKLKCKHYDRYKNGANNIPVGNLKLI